MPKVRFLIFDEVLFFRRMLIDAFGGSHGVRDQKLLESALGQRQASFAGEMLHPDHISMAAAYFFHIIQNHPFVDGNKRTGTFSALAFLQLNGISMNIANNDLYDMAIKVATSRAQKEDIIVLFKQSLKMDL